MVKYILLDNYIMSNFLSNLQLPQEVESSILGSVLSQVYVFVIDNAQSDNLASFLEKAGYTNILSKKENELTTITAQKELVFPEKKIVDENVNPDTPTCSGSRVNSCGLVTDPDTCVSSYITFTNSQTFNSESTQCTWGNSCVNGGAGCTP